VSNINDDAGGVQNSEIVAELSDRGTICISATTTAHLVIDAVGHL
jgi:hypothetical protein